MLGHRQPSVRGNRYTNVAVCFDSSADCVWLSGEVRGRCFVTFNISTGFSYSLEPHNVLGASATFQTVHVMALWCVAQEL